MIDYFLTLADKGILFFPVNMISCHDHISEKEHTRLRPHSRTTKIHESRWHRNSYDNDVYIILTFGAFRSKHYYSVYAGSPSATLAQY